MNCFMIPRRASAGSSSKRRSSSVVEVSEFADVASEADLQRFSDAELCNAKEFQLRELQAEDARALHSVKLLQESILFPDDEEDDYAPPGQYSRLASPKDYTLAIDHTTAKMITAVIDKCKLLQCSTSLFKGEGPEMQWALEGLQETLGCMVGCANLEKFQDVLEDIMLHATEAFAFLEKLCFVALPSSSHGVHKAAAKMREFACRFYNDSVRLRNDIEQSWDDEMSCEESPGADRKSFGIATYTVPVHNVTKRLLRKNRVHIPVTDLDGSSEYNVELSCPRSVRWSFSKDVPVSARIESHDKGFSQTLSADRVKVAKGSWGWDSEAQDSTVVLTYDDLVVANVASVSGSLLTFNRHAHYSTSQKSSSSTSPIAPQKYRTSIQIVGASRIDLDLQNLFIKGTRGHDHVYYKCVVNNPQREEVLAIYRYQQKQFRKGDGMLYIVGRGNQPGLRHVLVSIFASLGFTPTAR